LPPGIVSVEVDGQPIDAVAVPVTANATPEITGRVELGVPAIELAVADGEVIRFPAEVNARGRFGAAVPQALADGQYTLYINDVLIGAFAVDGAAGGDQERAPGPLLDIARVVPYPADFGDFIPGLGFLDGRFYALEEEAVRTASAENGGSAADVRETQRRLAEAGWLQRYENRLAAPNPGNPETFTIQFSSFVIEYASGADARTAFAALVGEDPGAEFETVGDESILTLLSGVTPDTGAEYQAARLIFRVGPLLGMIVYADLLNQQPDLGLLGAVAQSVAGRGAVIVDRQTIPLGSMTLRLDPSPATGRLIRRDLYDVRAGILTALYDEDEATRAGRVELFTGTTDSFSVTTSGTFGRGGRGDDGRQQQPAEPTQAPAPTPTSVIAIEGEAPPPEAPATPPPIAEPEVVPAEEQATAQVFMVSALYEFPGEAEADAWFVAQRDRLLAEAQSGAASFSEVPDAPSWGDASATFSLRRGIGAGEETAGGFRMYARVGPIVAVLEVGSVPDMPLQGAANLMEAQVTCIEESGCSGLASLPRSILDREAETEAAGEEPPAGEPVAEEAEETPAPVIIVEGEDPAEDATREPRADRTPRPDREERRRNRDREEQAPAG
jgi:hypothetical protein